MIGTRRWVSFSIESQSRSSSLVTAGMIAAGMAVGAVGITRGPKVQLATDTVSIAAEPFEVLLHLRARLTEDIGEVLAADGNAMVRRFSGTAGRFSYRTVEHVRFEPSAVTFEHLSGPFRACEERFDLSAIDIDTDKDADHVAGTRLTHSGWFVLRGGLWTAPLAMGPVRRAFENHVREHFEQMANDLR